jgi:hypothetical protein
MIAAAINADPNGFGTGRTPDARSDRVRKMVNLAKIRTLMDHTRHGRDEPRQRASFSTKLLKSLELMPSA